MKISQEFQAKALAHELTLRLPASNIGKFTATIQDAKVDLNPHQVEAALFAFQSPLSSGAILADEVGLGKTIEAGILISQSFAERKRKILIISPANLRKQWVGEMEEKFYLPSIILESKSFQEEIKRKNLNPFSQEGKIVVTSYQFARTKSLYIEMVEWDLVILDEAHRLRNVYKPNNKIGKAIKNALEGKKKILLTATPLQNSLLELYGLVSIIDEYHFGDLKSFKAQYGKSMEEGDFLELRNRLKPICIRTLRRQVLEYIQYTKRIAILEEFFPTEEEQELYEKVSVYLQRPKLYGLPNSQRQLMTLILRKLLASSTFAIQGTLETIIQRLEGLLERTVRNLFPIVSMEYESAMDLKDEWVQESWDQEWNADNVELNNQEFELERRDVLDDDQQADEEDGTEDNTEDEFDRIKGIENFTEEDLILIRDEIKDLREYKALAERIAKNSKAEHLIFALDKAFVELQKLGANQKALVFTESRRTQEFLFQFLEERGYKGKVVLFNGSNQDSLSNSIYNEWIRNNEGSDRVSGSPTADKRSALVDHFKNNATIMIATEAAAEGVNLQFCSLVVNYDMPWNPQRIEQRIGRCHRYGQKFDVVVVNFLNKKNAADERVYQLLDEKFQLFNGVFGASDEVLGAIGNGVDFEKRISQIYLECRTQEEIQAAFDRLQEEMSAKINDKMQSVRNALIENFDEEVHEKLRVQHSHTISYLNQFQKKFWSLTEYFLKDYALVNSEKFQFTLNRNPFPDIPIPLGNYQLVADKDKHLLNPNEEKEMSSHVYRFHHPLAESIIENCQDSRVPFGYYEFRLSDYPGKITSLEPYLGSSGFLIVEKYSIESFEKEESLIISCITTEGEILSEELSHRILYLPAFAMDETIDLTTEDRDRLGEQLKQLRNLRIQESQERNKQFFDEEMEKLEIWAQDRKIGLEKEIIDIDNILKIRKSDAKKILDLEAKILAQREIKDLEKRRFEIRRNLFEAQDEIDSQKDKLLDRIESLLRQKSTTEELFCIGWKLV